MRIGRTAYVLYGMAKEGKNRKISQVRIGRLEPDMTNIKKMTEHIVEKTHKLFYQVSNIYETVTAKHHHQDLI